MAIKTAQDANKAKLAQYTWTETETISIKGNVKDTKTYQVQMVNGKAQKTLVNDQKASPADVKAAPKSASSRRRPKSTKSMGSPSARWPSSTPRPIPRP